MELRRSAGNAPGSLGVLAQAPVLLHNLPFNGRAKLQSRPAIEPHYRSFKDSESLVANAPSHFCLLQDYFTVLRPRQIQLAVLNLYDKRQEDMMGRINALWESAADFAETLDKERVEDLPKVVAKLITSYMAHELNLLASSAAEAPLLGSGGAAAGGGLEHAAAAAASSSMASGSDRSSSSTRKVLQAPPYSELPEAEAVAMLTRGLAGIGSLRYSDAALEGGVQPADMYKHSPPGLPIPFAAEAAAAVNGPPGTSGPGGLLGPEVLEQLVEEAQAGLAGYRSSLCQSELYTILLQQVQQQWQQALLKPAVAGQVQRLVEVLEGEVLPHNKHTRRRAEESGPTLHLPGLIKAASSNYTNKKIFARKTAGGTRKYQVGLLLDVSQSMQGHLQQCSLEVVMMMTEALTQAGIEDFLMVTYGAGAVLVKDADTPWDQACQLALLEQVNGRTGRQGGLLEGTLRVLCSLDA